MALILHIETSTNVCSVALSRDGFLLYEKADDGSNGNSNAAERLGGFVSDALERLPDDGKLEAVSVSSGPGSYTGLRIGVSMAKGVCYGSDAQLISVPTLELLCVPVLLGDKIKATSWVDGKEEQLVEELKQYLPKVYVINPSADFNRAPVTEIIGMPYDLQTLFVKGR